MECICPNCGKKGSSGDLVFDLTAFIYEHIKNLITITTAIENSGAITTGWETSYNSWRETQPVTESEKALWALPEISKSIAYENQKCVSYLIPYGALEQRINQNILKKLSQTQDKLKEWFAQNRGTIERQFLSLWLIKDGDGEIRFNQIRVDGKLASGKCKSENRRCPNCKELVSYWAGRYKEIGLTVLGGPRVSKSTTLTACASAFMKERKWDQFAVKKERDYDICWEGSPEDKAWKSFKASYLDRYQNGDQVEATDTTDDKIPRVTFRVNFGNKRYLCLTFIDLPGEFNNQEGISDEIYEKYRNYYDSIDFIWYCTDPGEIRQLKGQEKQGLGYQEKQEIMDVSSICSNMNKMSSFFKKAGKLIPVAYIMGKTDHDLITLSEKTEFGLYDPDRENSFLPFDVEEFFERSQLVRKYMTKYNQTLVSAFEENFRDRCYIAVSAYGYDPRDPASKNKKMEPYQCRLPFLWMLALRNGIEITARIGRQKLFGRIQYEENTDLLNDFPPKAQMTIRDNLCMHSSEYTLG